jgi:hypothetical protein
MPKEILHDNTIPEGATNSTPMAIQVTWFREGSVEIASINLDKEQHTEERGWFTFMNRKMINDLIKVLRKARDQAYGADE